LKRCSYLPVRDWSIGQSAFAEGRRGKGLKLEELRAKGQ
jgi:hypothetical protein